MGIPGAIMEMTHTTASLIAFERRVADAFAARQIAAPVHLSSDEQAEPLLTIFKMIKPGDWVCSTWRSHFHALLKGIPEEELFAQILDGRSMFVMSKAHRFLSSAIVGGMLPVAVGLGMGIKMDGGSERVWVFVGDMTERTGLYHEAVQFVQGHGLPVEFVVENNGYSTNAVTEEVWGVSDQPIRTHRYDYRRSYPHVGLLQRVSF